VEKQVYHFIKGVISHNVLDKDITSLLSYIQQVMMHRKKHNARSNITGTLRVCICSKLWFQSNCRFETNKQLFVSRGNSHISHPSYSKLIQCLYLKQFSMRRQGAKKVQYPTHQVCQICDESKPSRFNVFSA